MKSVKRLCAALCMAFIATGGSATNMVITVFQGQGMLSWTNTTEFSYFDVEWAFGTNDFTVDLRIMFTDLPTGHKHIIGLHEAGVNNDWLFYLYGTHPRFVLRLDSAVISLNHGHRH